MRITTRPFSRELFQAKTLVLANSRPGGAGADLAGLGGYVEVRMAAPTSCWKFAQEEDKPPASLLKELGDAK